MKNYLLTVLLYTCALHLSAQNDEPGIIKGGSGIGVVYVEPGDWYGVFDTLYENDFFRFRYMENSAWVRVTQWKGIYYRAGYLYHGNVRSIYKLENPIRKEVITTLLTKRKTLATDLQTALQQKDSLTIEKAKQALTGNRYQYESMLNMLHHYFCQTSDTSVLQLLFATLWADKDSDVGSLYFCLGHCLLCNNDLVVEQLLKLKAREQKDFLLDQFELGLKSYFGNRTDADLARTNFYELKTLLESARKKVSR